MTIYSSKDLLRMSSALLLREKFFYYNLFIQFRIKESTAIPTAGVSWVDGAFHFIYNPDFILHYTPRELMYILEHECNHFCFEHVKQFKTSGVQKVFKDEKDAADYVRDNMLKKAEHQMQNIAMDCSINQFIPRLPKIKMTMADLIKSCKKPEDLTKAMEDGVISIQTDDPTTTIVDFDGITLPSFKRLLTKSGYTGNLDEVKQAISGVDKAGWKYYYDLLKNCPETEKAMEGIKNMDIHFAGEGEVPEGEAEKIIVEAYKANVNNNGDLPGHLRSMIDLAIQTLQGKPLPWNKMFRKLLNNAKKTVMVNDINQRNRNVPGSVTCIIPGYNNKPLYKVGVVLDVSGSFMSPEDQELAWTEVQALIKCGAEATIYYTDSYVEHTQTIKPFKKLTIEDYQAKGGGGTDLDVGIKKAIEDKNDIVVLLTDGMTPWRLTKSDLKGKKVITVTTVEEAPAHYGPCIKIENR